MKPRILFVDHVGVLGGAELSLLDIADYFKATSRVVLFEDGSFRERLQQRGVLVTVLSMQGVVSRVSREGGILQDLRALPGVVGLAWNLANLARGYDLIYANSQKSMIVAAIAAMLARRPLVWHLRDLMIKDHFSTLHRKLATWIANLLVTHIIANSYATKQGFVSGGGKARKICVVHNGIDAGPFEGVNRDEVDALRTELGLQGVPVVGLFSRLAPWKGQHVLLEALSALPSVHAILVGDALFEADRAYVANLHRIIDRLGITGRVHFLGFRRDVPRLLKLVDVVVHTSVAPEPFGRVIVEGMLAQRPVVATAAGGALEIIEPERTGVLVPPGDPIRLAAAIRELLDSPEKAHAMAAAGHKEAVKRFSVRSMLSVISEQVYNAAGNPIHASL